ncbi:MAG: hypothetical protein K2X93_08815 [Candidatus Obscuribacterales bacterium]|nr:hypothetical protein [Candidatus Obscuribacterales bacterium]
MVYNSFEQASGTAATPDLSSIVSDAWAVDIRNQRPPESPPENPPEERQERELPPAPTMEQMTAMREAAEQGRLNDTAATVFLRGLATNGTRGLAEARDALNQHLTTQNSEYRARIARVDRNGEVNFIVMLQRNGENLNTMATDVIRNGRNSQYAGRAIVFELTPQRVPDV